MMIVFCLVFYGELVIDCGFDEWVWDWMFGDLIDVDFCIIVISGVVDVVECLFVQVFMCDDVVVFEDLCFFVSIYIV